MRLLAFRSARSQKLRIANKQQSESDQAQELLRRDSSFGEQVVEGLLEEASIGGSTCAPMGGAGRTRTLWRGISHVRSGALRESGFLEHGGTMPEVISASSDLTTALEYATQALEETREVILLQIIIHDSSNCLLGGAKLNFLSCFPEEEEEAFAPLTLMKPWRREETLDLSTRLLRLLCGTPEEERQNIKIFVGDITFTILRMYPTQ
jgi:hypothetical protein